MTILREGLALLLLAHGVAHLPGFLAAWRLVEIPQLPHTTTVFGGMLDIGHVGIRAVGILWLMVGAASVTAASAVLLRSGWAPAFVSIVLALSTVLCIAGWPAARLGLLANVVIAGLALLVFRLGVFGTGLAS